MEAGAAVTALASVLGFFGGLHWSLDLLSHFRIQYAVLLAVAAVVLAGGRRWKPAGLAGIVAAVSAIPLAPYYLEEPVTCSPAADTLRLMALNVNTTGGDPAAVLELIEGEAPDLVLLMEVSRAWVDRIQTATGDAYPHRVAVPREDNFGIALLSRREPDDLRIVHLGAVPSVEARVRPGPGSDPVTVLGTHPVPPAGGEGSARRDRQLEAVAERVRRSPAPTLVVGDLNATPWSDAFRRLLADGGLRDSGRGRGLHPTWHGGTAAFAIPIDHALVTPGLCVTERRVGGDVGSDHRPLFVSVVLDERSE